MTVSQLNISLAQLRDIISYDPETGVFRWIRRSRGRTLGSVAGTDDNGYWKICVNRQTIHSHRLAWFYITGEWPRQYIDHINGNPSDNRFANLREATPGENQRNMKAKAGSKTGLKGVITLKDPKRKQKFAARIIIDGAKYELGRFYTAEEAHEAYCKAALELHGRFARFR